MPQKDVYRYLCETENKFIREKVDVGDSVPAVCKNNAGHSVDWATLTLLHKAHRKAEFGLENVSNTKDNLNALDKPTEDHDAASGYSIGSKWIDIIDNKVYFCVDATVGNADWKKSDQVIGGENIGTAGVGIYKEIKDEKIRLKKLNPASNKISIFDDTSNDKIDFDIVVGNININNLGSAPAGTVVGTTANQTLTNKTINADQNTITNIDNADIKAGASINATKIATGSVNNTQFGYLSGASGNIQSQINNHTGNTSNPHSVTKSQVGLGNVSNLKTKLDANAAPTVTDDSSAGYGVGSNWVDILNDKAYICVDASNNAAIWTEVTAGGAGAGEVNTASNVGSGGLGLFKQKAGTDLQFRNINIGSNKLSITLDAANNEVDLDIVESNVNIGNLNGAPSGAVVGTTDTQTLSSKNLVDTTVSFCNVTDNSKKIRFGLAGITTGTTRTITFPDASITVAGVNATQTFTNKTIDTATNTVTNLTNSNIASGAAIDVTKIADGSVSNTELGYLNGVTSALQTQLDSKIDYFEDNLIYLENGNPGDSNHVKFKITKNDAGNDDYNLGIDSDPVKIIFTCEDGLYRQACVISADVATPQGTIFGLSSSSNSGSTWDPCFVVEHNSYVGINTNSPEYQLHVNGDSCVNGYIEISDISEPSSPQDGRGRLYKKSGNDGLFWKPDSAGNEIDLTTGVGGSTSRKFDAYFDPGSDTYIGTGWYDVDLNQERVKDSDFTHSSNSSEVTINTPGYYFISARCSTKTEWSGSRTNSVMRLLVNTGNDWDEIPGTYGYMYNRNNKQGSETASITFIQYLANGDKIKMQATRFSGGGYVHLIRGGSSITIFNV